MAVRVRTNDGQWDDQPSGIYIQVKDGHLEVMGRVPNITQHMQVALYAPGQWERAEVLPPD